MEWKPVVFVRTAFLVNLCAMILTVHGIVLGYVIEVNYYPAFLIGNFGVGALVLSFSVFWVVIFRYHQKIGEFLSPRCSPVMPPERYNLAFSATLLVGMVPDLVNNLLVFGMYLNHFVL